MSLITSLGFVLKRAISVRALRRNFVDPTTDDLLTKHLPVAVKLQYEKLI